MDIRFLHRNAFDAFRRAKRVLIIAHKNPDGDTLGAAAAMLNFCRAYGIAADAYCFNEIPEAYRYMPGTEDFTHDPGVFKDPPHDLIAVFDAGDLRFAGVADLVAALPTKPFMVNFDHHATNERFGDINIVDTAASSTAEVVHHFFETCGITVDRAMSDCILAGILFDTGSFSNPATTVSSLRVASDLLRRGAKIKDFANNIIRNKPIGALRLWGQVLARLKFDQALGVASTAVFAKDMADGAVEDDHVDGISNFLNGFLDARVVLVLKELPDGKVKGSFRSSDDTDVSVPAKLLGGGGHKKASGFTIAGKIVEMENGWKVI